MKKILIILSLWSLTASANPIDSIYRYDWLAGKFKWFAVPTGYTRISARYNWLAGYFDALTIPAFSTTPSLTSGQWIGAGAVGIDSVLHRMYFYSGGSWRRLAAFSDILTGLTPNANVGSGYRWLVASSQEIKTAFAGIDILIDSATNSNGLTVHADTTAGATHLATQGDITRALQTSGSLDSVIVYSNAQTDTLYQYFANGDSDLVHIFDRNCGIVQPGIVTNDSLLVFTISPSIQISCCDGSRITYPETHITLDPADGTDPRYDAFVMDEASGTVIKITGVADPNPVLPQPGQCQQLLTYIYVPANATTVVNIVDRLIYDENVGAPTEWPGVATSVTTNFGGVTNPYHLTKTSDLGAVTSASHIDYTSTDSITITNYTALRFFLRLKSGFVNNTRFQFSFWNNGQLVSTVLTMPNATYGYNRLLTGIYQAITIPLTEFGFFSSTVDALRIQFTGSNGFGCYIDWITLQGGISQPQPANQNFVQNIYRKPAKDSIYFTILGVEHAIKDSLGITSIPNLQQVTDAGNITTNNINASGYFVRSSANALRINVNEAGTMFNNGYSAAVAQDNTNGNLYLQSSAFYQTAGNFPGYGTPNLILDTLGGVQMRNIVYNHSDSVDVLVQDTTGNHETYRKRILFGAAAKPALNKAVTIEAPTNAENVGMWYTPVAITVSSVESVLVGSSSPSVTFNIAFGSDRTSGTNVFTSGRTVTSTTTGLNSNSSFNDATIPAGSFIWVTTSAQSGTVTQIELTINYTED